MSSDKAYRALHLKYCALKEELAAAQAQRDKLAVALKEIREVCGLALNAGCLTPPKKRTPSIYSSKWECGK